MELDDFIKYAKEKFGCEVSIEKSENPDTFDKTYPHDEYQPEHNSPAPQNISVFQLAESY